MEIIVTSSILVASVVVSLLITRRKKATFRDFETLRVVLDYHCQQAYRSIYKSRIMVYSVNATKLVGKELDEIKREYCDLTLKLLGPKLTRDLREVYGDSLLFNILLYFEEKYDEDEIYSATVNKMKEEADHGS